MGLLSLCTSRRQLFNLTDRQSSSRGAVRVAHAQLLLGNREQRTAVSGRELPFFDPLLDLLVELEQTNRVRHRSAVFPGPLRDRSEEHTSELQSRLHLVCRLLLEKKKQHRKLV